MIPTVERGVHHPETDREGILARSDFDVDLVEAYKALPAPRMDRRWCPQKDGWWFAPDLEDAVVEILVATFGECGIFGKDGEGDVHIDRDGVVRQTRPSTYSEDNMDQQEGW